MTRYHFLDESGDPGIEQRGTSSSYFILAMAELPNRQPIAELTSIRKELGLPLRYEFKYYRSRASLKNVFFRAVQSLPFQVRAAVLDKSKVPNDLRITKGPDLTIELFTRLALRIPESAVCDDVLIIDGATPKFKRSLRRRLSKAYRRTGRKRLFKKIVGQKSQSSDGLQLVDMIAGAIRQCVTGQESRYFNSVEHRIVDFWLVSKNKTPPTILD
jgi:hypothetical protein